MAQSNFTSIRTTLAAVGLIVAGIGTAISLTAFLSGQAVLAGQHRAVGLGDPGSVRAVLSAGGYLTAMGLIGVAVGALLRTTVAAVLAVLAIGLGPSLLGGLFPSWVRDHVLHYLPGPVGNRSSLPKAAAFPAGPALCRLPTMAAEIRMTVPVARVLAALVADPTADHYGLELIHASGLPSGTLYPILARLTEAGWLEKRWEEVDSSAAGRPARAYYRITSTALPVARQRLAELHEQTRTAPTRTVAKEARA